ncbi:double-strand break repair helicase AddA [Oryzifoliimicrobium ureilyticus]|uniref:double-strand break repair helicase AddA n=1 Tax=Oryzifoliimicrobium ureilyticus TaxID=3113724 RepID=UPI0030763B77
MNDVFPLPESDEPREWVSWTTIQQTIASDPKRSAWVSANAGSGKTHVLTQRVIRLLLAGARPSAILCLTYTKAAASEMSNRVFQRLADWAVLDDEALSQRIAAIEGAQPDRIKLAEARRLFAKALETPGGLKIQTIHAFCEALLHQFPLEANVAGHFSVLDDRAASTLLTEARRRLLTATTEDDSQLSEAFSHILNLADEAGLEGLLADIVAQRNAIQRFLAYSAARGGTEHVLRARLDLSPTDSEATMAARYWPLPGLQGPMLQLYLDVAADKGGAKPQEVAANLRSVVGQTDVVERVRLLERIFLTQDGRPKSDREFLAKAMLAHSPVLAEAVDAARAHVAACRDRLKVVRMFEATRAALILAERLNRDYDALKKQRSQLDFEDLITRTADLLTKSGVGPWIHYKLDQGIDHILVDEAQDTSPIQWEVIQSLAEDFFSGESARTTLRTLFAVGDEKQSIYSFQGARPERFSEESMRTQRRVSSGGQLFSSVRLPLSFRSTADVLAAVDHIFSSNENARGLSAQAEPVVHRSSRIGHPGAVDLWEMIAPAETIKDEDWTAPFDATPETAPPAVLARRIADTIATLVGRETVVEKGRERRIEPGDILVLVRKRDSFVTALTRALKHRGRDIPVAGADRLVLTSHIAIQDLMALGRFVLLPKDDLSLACLLKSPLFDLTEDDLFELAAKREETESLWERLQTAAQILPHYAIVVGALRTFISQSKQYSVHDFYSRVLGLHGGRRKFLGRLGTEVSDIIDEFLTFTLDHETNGLPGLQSFISTLELEAPEVKREQDKDRNEVRIMTVHASKGLEAPVVFLVDGGAKAFSSSHMPKLRLIKSGHDEPPTPVWVPLGDLGNAITEKDGERIRSLAEDEYRRLLYVAMTRAADRLIVCGYRGSRAATDNWHTMISKALSSGHPHVAPARFHGPDGEWEGFSWRTPSMGLTFERFEEETEADFQSDLPSALGRPLPPQRQLPRPLSPSGAGTMVDDEADDTVFVSPLFDKGHGSSFALQRGRLIHRMLQILPDLPREEQDAAASRYIERAAGFWPKSEKQSLKSTILTLLQANLLQPFFSGHSQAEVSIMGTLDLDGTQFAISGRVDRLTALEDRVVLLDYKTNRSAPLKESDIAFSHIAQMAVYRRVLEALYPDKLVQCLLVYTQNGSIFHLSDMALTAALARLGAK